MLRFPLTAAAPLALLIAALTTGCATGGEGASSAAADATAEPTWRDEFDGSGPVDTTKWAYDLGGGGWGNNELQDYTDSTANARREDGHLVIEARRERSGGRDYSSARLVTRGKRSFTYGRVAVRARLPTGRGTWPAIWTLGTNIDSVGWPACGEIDIMEHVGFGQDTLYATVHTTAFNHVDGTAHTDTLVVPGASDAFHVYAIDWRPDSIVTSVDDVPYATFRKVDGASPAQWPFDAPQYLLLNVAVGGNWGGRYGVDTTIWPQRMEVDWVRVWE